MFFFSYDFYVIGENEIPKNRCRFMQVRFHLFERTLLQWNILGLFLPFMWRSISITTLQWELRKFWNRLEFFRNRSCWNFQANFKVPCGVGPCPRQKIRSSEAPIKFRWARVGWALIRKGGVYIIFFRFPVSLILFSQIWIAVIISKIGFKSNSGLNSFVN